MPHNSCQILRTLPDARVQVERGHERERRTIRDLARAGRANCPTSISPGSKVLVGGLPSVLQGIAVMTFPLKFNPSLPSRYDRTTPPLDFLQLYSLTVYAAKGDDKCMANWLPMALKGAAITWLMNLPEGSIHSFKELCLQFGANFQGLL